VLKHDTILEVSRAAVVAGLDRHALVAALDPHLRMSLPLVSSPGGQILSDLNELNRVGQLPDGTVPLRIVLQTAEYLAGPRQETQVFKQARAELDAVLQARSASAQPSASVTPASSADAHATLAITGNAAPSASGALTSVSSPPDAIDASDPILQDLRSAYVGGNLIVFVGAGVSAAGGLPTWGPLTDQILTRLRKVASSNICDEAEGYKNRGQYIEALSAARLGLGALEFDLAIETALNDRGRDVPEVAQAIAALQSKLRAVLTTNLDHFLERAFAGAWPALARPTGDLASRRHYILKLHGTLLERDTWVFVRSQYDRAIFASPALQETFRALFRACPILFVGCGLADDNLDQTLGSVRALSGDSPPMHFALLPEPIGPLRRQQLEAAGVRLVTYPAGAHSYVLQVLRWLDSV
jgi:hypothetical protein